MAQASPAPVQHADVVRASPLFPIIERATRKDVAERYASAEQMVADLDAGLRALEAPADRVSAAATLPAASFSSPNAQAPIAPTLPSPAPTRSRSSLPLLVAIALTGLSGVSVVFAALALFVYFDNEPARATPSSSPLGPTQAPAPVSPSPNPSARAAPAVTAVTAGKSTAGAPPSPVVATGPSPPAPATPPAAAGDPVATPPSTPAAKRGPGNPCSSNDECMSSICCTSLGSKVGASGKLCASRVRDCQEWCNGQPKRDVGQICSHRCECSGNICCSVGGKQVCAAKFSACE